MVTYVPGGTVFVYDSEEVDGRAKSYYIFRRADVINNVDRYGYEKKMPTVTAQPWHFVFLVGSGEKEKFYIVTANDWADEV